MSTLGTTTILGDLIVTGDIKGNNVSGGGSSDNCITTEGNKIILGNVNGYHEALGIKNINAGENAMSLLRFHNDLSPTAGLFRNSSTRTADGGINSFNIYNDGGSVNLRSNNEVNINGCPLILTGGQGNYREGIRINQHTSGWATLTMGGSLTVGTDANTWSIHRNPSNQWGVSCGSSDFYTNGLALHPDGNITWKTRYIAQMTSANGYFGLVRPTDGSSQDWIRTTMNGIIPYQSGGFSSLGTDSWPFSALFANEVYMGSSRAMRFYQTVNSIDIADTNVKQAYTAIVTSNNSAPNTDWWHIFNMPHSDNNGYGGQIALGFHGYTNMYARTASGTTWSPWRQIGVGDNNNYLTCFSRVYNAVWNDYAEYFEKQNPEDQDFEPGDVIVSIDNKYVKSTSAYQETVIGVYSDSYGHIVGGTGNYEIDDKECIPVGLSGRVDVKVIGKIKNGQLLTSSDIPGVAMYAKDYKPGTVIGKAVEDKNTEEIGKVKMFIMNI